MKTMTVITFGGIEYTCRIVKDNQGEDQYIGSLALLDAMHPGSFDKSYDVFVGMEAQYIYEDFFFYTEEENLLLPDDKLIEILHESNPNWF